MTIRVDPLGPQDYPESLYHSDRPAATLPDLNSIGTDEVALYREQGYLAVDRALSSAQVQSALDGLGDLVGDPPAGMSVQLEAGAGDLRDADRDQRMDAVRRLMGFAAVSERLRSIAYDTEILRVVRMIIGEADVRMFSGHGPAEAARRRPGEAVASGQGVLQS